MSRGKWPRPTPAEIKRVIKASLDLGPNVTGYRVDEHGISITTVPLNPDEPRPSSKNEWDV